MAGELPSRPAALRNREPILRALREILPDRGRVLELASGTGEHVVHFAPAFPGIVWQPTDVDPEALAVAESRLDEANLSNVEPVRRLDALSPGDWPPDPFDAVLAINLVHISPRAVTTAILERASERLSPGGAVIFYGPWKIPERPLEPTNAAFDRSLRSRNSEWGLRDLGEVRAEAESLGFQPGPVVDLPANNVVVVFRR